MTALVIGLLAGLAVILAGLLITAHADQRDAEDRAARAEKWAADQSAEIVALTRQLRTARLQTRHSQHRNAELRAELAQAQGREVGIGDEAEQWLAAGAPTRMDPPVIPGEGDQQ